MRTQLGLNAAAVIDRWNFGGSKATNWEQRGEHFQGCSLSLWEPAFVPLEFGHPSPRKRLGLKRLDL
jgi:hypothetical protein